MHKGHFAVFRTKTGITPIKLSAVNASQVSQRLIGLSRCFGFNCDGALSIVQTLSIGHSGREALGLAIFIVMPVFL